MAITIGCLRLAADLVRRQVAVIVARWHLAAQAAKTATATVPIVFLTGFNPVEYGLVASLNRPGGNLTGVSNLNTELGPKRLELLHHFVPTATAIALIVNPDNSNAEAQLREMEATARTMGLQLRVLKASTDGDFDTAIAALGPLQVGGIVLATDGFYVSRSGHFGASTARHRVPAIFQNCAFVSAGGLMSYGGSDAGRPPCDGPLRRSDFEGRKASRPARPTVHEG